VSEPIVYKITTEFVTDRTLEIEELVALAQSSYRKVVEPDADSMDEDEPYVVVDPVLRVWAGDNEIGGLNPKPVYHVYLAFYEMYEKDNRGTTRDVADDFYEECFISWDDANVRSDFYLDQYEGFDGVRIVSGVRMITVSARIHEILSKSDWGTSNWESWTLEDHKEWIRWCEEERWNSDNRVAEHLRYRTMTRP
jgi:hypothetical protein